jgi:hypothetical protein
MDMVGTPSGSGLNLEPYRDGQRLLRERRDGLLARRRFELRLLPAELERIYARRVGRHVAGTVGIAGAVGVLLATLFSKGMAALGARPLAVSATVVLLATLPCAALAYVLARCAAANHLEGQLEDELSTTPDVSGDVTRLESWSPWQSAVERARSLEERSAGWFLMAAALLGPLSLHFAVWLLLTDPAKWIEGFDWWIALSALLVLPAHVVLALLARRFALQLSERDSKAAKTLDGWAAWKWTCLAGLVPGGIVYLIPTALVALTGAVFIPAVFAWMRDRILAERQQLETLAKASPASR